MPRYNSNNVIKKKLSPVKIVINKSKKKSLKYILESFLSIQNDRIKMFT